MTNGNADANTGNNGISSGRGNVGNTGNNGRANVGGLMGGWDNMSGQ